MKVKSFVKLLTVLAMTGHSYALVTSGVVEYQQGFEICDMKDEYREVLKVISIVDGVASLVIPLIMIIGMNFVIVKNLKKVKRAKCSAEHKERLRRLRSMENLSEGVVRLAKF